MKMKVKLHLLEMRFRILVFTVVSFLTVKLGHWLFAQVHNNRFIPESIDLLTASARELSGFLQNGTVTSEQLCQEYIKRINAENDRGLHLRAILHLTPFQETLQTARALDAERRQGRLRSALHGVPLVVKDNMWTAPDLELPTTFGAYAFENATAPTDARLVARARDAGLIILGKSNLDELNGFKDPTAATGWSALGGSIKSPYDEQHPCGSSGGSAVSVAAGFVPLSVGTETQGSISCPASFTATYGIKVSTGLIPRHGILPSSTTFDSPGIFAHNAWDLGALLHILAESSYGNSEIDAEGPEFVYVPAKASSWKDWRICIADRDYFWTDFGDSPDAAEEEKMFRHAESVIAQMKLAGATIVDDCKFPSARNVYKGKAARLMEKIIKHEMVPGMDRIFAQMNRIPVHSVQELVEFNRQHPDRAFSSENYGQGYLEAALEQRLSHDKYQEYLDQAEQWGVHEGLSHVFAERAVDALVLPAWTDMSLFAAWSGSPTGTVSLGLYGNGKPYGLGFVTPNGTDAKLIQLMHLYETSFDPHLAPPKMRQRNVRRVVRKVLEHVLWLLSLHRT